MADARDTKGGPRKGTGSVEASTSAMRPLLVQKLHDLIQHTGTEAAIREVALAKLSRMLLPAALAMPEAALPPGRELRALPMPPQAQAHAAAQPRPAPDGLDPPAARMGHGRRHAVKHWSAPPESSQLVNILA